MLKIVVIGPKGSGKTCISNYIANQRDTLQVERYDPTVGTRILEVESKIGGNSANIEIWDTSGDSAYEGCWKAMMADASGIILVYNPDAPGQDQQILDWFDYFVRKNGLMDEQCMIFAHRSSPNQNPSDRFRPPPLFSRVTAALTTLQSGPDIKNMFDNFTKELYNAKSRK